MVEPRAVVRALIVSVHPEPSSFHASLREAAAEEFQAQGYEVQVSDLYAMGFKAVLDREDFLGCDDERLNVSHAERKAWK